MAVTLNASTTAGLVQTADTSGVLALQTAGTTAVTVDASQNTTLAGKLDVTKRATFAAPASFGAISASTGTVEAHTLYGNVIAGNGSSYDVMIVNRNGAESLGVIANTQNLITAGTFQSALAISVGNATPTTSGAGITFPATQSASSNANTLDDYEEGTWTPTVGANSVDGTHTYTSQLGTYTKVGRLVTVQCAVAMLTKGGTIAGDIQIVGLPFTSFATMVEAGAVGYFTGLATNVVMLKVYINASVTRINISKMAAAGANMTQMVAADVSASTALYVSASYYTT